MSLEIQRELYISKRKIVKALEQYALGYLHALENIDLSPAVRKELMSDEGKLVLQKWMNRFSDTLAHFRVFDSQRLNGVRFNNADWMLMSANIDRLLHTAEIPLLESALSKCVCQEQT